MTFQAALVAALLALLSHEDPSLQRSPERLQQFEKSVETLTKIHVEVGSQGSLVSPHADAVLLSSVNYAETRVRLPAPKGDCYQTHPYKNVPSLRWPTGYIPKMRWVCPAVGPMNVAQGNRFVVHKWPEITRLLPDIVDQHLTVAQLEDPRTNILVAYGILQHWKNECPNKRAHAAPAAWLTSYRWGRCTPQHWNKRYFDAEARKRCERAQQILTFIRQRDVKLDIPDDWSCLPRTAAT